MDDYLPPIVTRLKGDWSDLRAAFIESRAAAQAWATGMREDIVSGMRNAGRDGGNAFAKALREAAGKDLLDEFDRDVGSKIRKTTQKTGTDAGMSFVESMVGVVKGMLMPALVAVIIMATPMIGAAIASAISLGVGLGFVGIAAFVQKSNPQLIKAFESFKKIVGDAFKFATAPMVWSLVESLRIIADGASRLAAPFRAIYSAIGDSVINLAYGLVNMVEELMPGLTELAPVAASLISTMAVVLPDIGAGLGGLFSELAKAGPDMIIFIEDFGAVMRDVLPMVGTLLADLARLYTFTEHGKGKGFGFLGGPELLVAAWPKVVQGAKDAWGWIKKVAAAVGEWVSGKAKAVGDWWNGLVEAVKTKGKQVQDWFEALPGRIGDWLAALPGKMRDAMFRAFDAFFFTLGFVVARAGQFIGMMITFFQTLPERIGMIILNLWNNVRQKTVQGAEDTRTTVLDWAKRLPVILEGLWNDFVNWGKRTWESVTNWVFKTVSDVIVWWNSLPTKIAIANGKIIETIREWGRKAGDWLLQTGKDLVQGLINGITSMAGAVASAVKRAIEKAIEGAKKALGIASPSRVFAEMGRFSMLGFVQGLQGERGTLANAWNSLTAPVIGTAGAPAAALAGGGGETIVVQFNIDGERFDEKTIERAQRRKNRTGTTGLA